MKLMGLGFIQFFYLWIKIIATQDTVKALLGKLKTILTWAKRLLGVLSMKNWVLSRKICPAPNPQEHYLILEGNMPLVVFDSLLYNSAKSSTLKVIKMILIP